jgi:hypothetical protein
MTGKHESRDDLTPFPTPGKAAKPSLIVEDDGTMKLVLRPLS